MSDVLYASVIEEFVPFMVYAVFCGLGLTVIVSALSWTVLLVTKLLHNIT